MKDKQTSNSNILFYFAVCFLPNVFLFFLFNSNKHRNNLYFSHFAVLAAIFALLGVLLFLLYRKITHSSEAAVAVSLFSWTTFWLFEAIISLYDWNSYVFLQRIVLLVGFAAVTSVFLWFFRIHSAAVSKYRSAFIVLAVTVCVLLVYNFAPALYTEVLLFAFGTPQGEIHEIETEFHSEDSSVSVHTPQRGGLYEIKTDFTIDDSLPKPDIYWFHMDEMIGFSAVEKYFGEVQDELKSELVKRGFVINEDAVHRAPLTAAAFSSLLSPTFHDSYLGPFYSNHEHLLNRQLSYELYDRLKLDGINMQADIHSQHEIFLAFKAVDYTVVASGGVFRPPDIVYRRDKSHPLAIISDAESLDAWREDGELRRFDDLRKLLTSTTPLSLINRMISEYIGAPEGLWLPIPEYLDVISQYSVRRRPGEFERHLYRILYDSFSVPSPKLVYLVNLIAHSPYDAVFQLGELENPSFNSRAVDLLYLPNYKYAAEVMLSKIDMVLD